MSQTKFALEKFSAFQKVFLKEKLDGFLVTDHLDQFYLTHFRFGAGETVFLVAKKGIVCFTRSLYVEPFSKFAPYMEVIGEDADRLSVAMSYARKLGLKKVGFDASKIGYLAGKNLVANGFLEAPGFLAQFRQVKDAQELKFLRASNRLAYQTYEYIKPRIKTGMTETQVAAEMERFMRANGASGTSFDTIVAFGENAANPHHVTGARKLKAQDAVLLDFGCLYEGYCADMTRSWWHGSKAPAEYTKIWNLVETARKTGIKTVKEGVRGSDVDAAARAVIEKAGYGAFFTHGTGHGVGIEIHESPYTNQQEKSFLKEGNVVTVEPGIYLPGKFGVRLEDTVAVTKTGAKILTKK